jgi:hypothetical protein
MKQSNFQEFCQNHWTLVYMLTIFIFFKYFSFKSDNQLYHFIVGISIVLFISALSGDTTDALLSLTGLAFAYCIEKYHAMQQLIYLCLLESRFRCLSYSYMHQYCYSTPLLCGQHEQPRLKILCYFPFNIYCIKTCRDTNEFPHNSGILLDVRGVRYLQDAREHHFIISVES